MNSSLPSILVASTWTMSPPASLTDEPGGHADLVLGLQLAVVEAGRAEVVLERLGL